MGRHPAVYLMGRGAIPPVRAFSRVPCGTRGIRYYPSFRAAIPGRGRFSTCYSAVRHSLPPEGVPFDLHVLGAPPAFILSQDRTLRPKYMGFEPVRSSQFIADRFRSIHMVLV